MDALAESKRRLSLTKSQLREEAGAELLSLLTEIAGDGKVSTTEIARLTEWLQRNRSSSIPAVAYLAEVVDRILADGKVTDDERLELQLGIEKVLPVTERGMARDAREVAEMAYEGPKITKSDLKKMADATPRRPPIIPRDWHSDPMTESQRGYIKSLGGKIRPGATKGEASSLIDELLGNRPITSRQAMVLRFWARVRQVGEGPSEISVWMDQFYAEDPDRKAAWELFKNESEDNGLQGDPNRVPLGVGPEYLARIKKGGPDALPKFRPASRQTRRTRPIIVGAVAVGLLLAVGYFVLQSPPPNGRSAEKAVRSRETTQDRSATVSSPPAPPAEPAQMKPAQSANASYIQSIKVSGIFGGKRARASIDGKLFSVGDVFSYERGLLIHRIDERERTVSFIDTAGEVYLRRMD